MSKIRILLITGSSGGHICPALGLLDILNKECHDLDMLLVVPSPERTGRPISFKDGPRPERAGLPVPLKEGPRLSALNKKKHSGYNIRYISLSGVKLDAGFNLPLCLFKIFLGTLESIWILLGFRPNLVIGFGSLASVPMLLSARTLGIKTMIHEQNVIPGKANMFLARFSDRIAVSFPQTRDYFRGFTKKVVVTGNPLRQDLVRMDKEKALAFFGFSTAKITLLVAGGSQGSRKINTVFPEAIKGLNNHDKIQVIHLCGIHDYELLNERYKDLRINVRLFGFLEEMQYAYNAADLILCRGGATTLAEIIYFGIPALIIPYPYARAHQAKNAEVLKQLGAAVVIDDDKLSEDTLRPVLETFLKDPKERSSMLVSFQNFLRVDAARVFMHEVLSCLG